MSNIRIKVKLSELVMRVKAARAEAVARNAKAADAFKQEFEDWREDSLRRLKEASHENPNVNFKARPSLRVLPLKRYDDDLALLAMCVEPTLTLSTANDLFKYVHGE